MPLCSFCALFPTLLDAVGGLSIACWVFVGCYTLIVLLRSDMSLSLLPSPVEPGPVKHSIRVNSNDYWCSDFFNGVEEVLVVPPKLGDNSFLPRRLHAGSKRAPFILPYRPIVISCLEVGISELGIVGGFLGVSGPWCLFPVWLERHGYCAFTFLWSAPLWVWDAIDFENCATVFPGE